MPSNDRIGVPDTKLLPGNASRVGGKLTATRVVMAARNAINGILNGTDDRLLVVVGPLDRGLTARHDEPEQCHREDRPPAAGRPASGQA